MVYNLKVLFSVLIIIIIFILYVNDIKYYIKLRWRRLLQAVLSAITEICEFCTEEQCFCLTLIILNPSTNAVPNVNLYWESVHMVEAS